MIRIPTYYLSFLIIIFGFATVSAQDPDPNQSNSDHTAEIKNRVITLIQSPSVKDRAWGAYLTGQNELSELAPALLDLLSEIPDQEQEDLNLVALDSLIRLKDNSPSERLIPFYQRYSDQVLILLARSPVENKDALLSIARQPRNVHFWVASCNLLTELKAPGFTAFLLKDLKISIDIIVVSQGRYGYGFGSGQGSVVGCGGSVNITDGFPPVAFYRLKDEPIRDAVVIAPGIHPIFYERRLYYPGNPVGISESVTRIDKDRYTIEYLAALLDKRIDELALKAAYSHTVAWAGTEGYRQDVMRIKESVIGDFSQVKKHLSDVELLTTLEAEEVKPNLVIRITDMRRNKKYQLPEISGVTIN